MTGSVQSKSTCWLEPGDLRFPAAASVQRTACWSSRSGEVQTLLDQLLHAATAGLGTLTSSASSLWQLSFLLQSRPPTASGRKWLHPVFISPERSRRSEVYRLQRFFINWSAVTNSMTSRAPGGPSSTHAIRIIVSLTALPFEH